MSNVVCGVSIVIRWKASEPYKNADGCSTVVRCAWLADKERRMDLALLMALQEKDVKMCGVADRLVF